MIKYNKLLINRIYKRIYYITADIINDLTTNQQSFKLVINILR